MSGALPLSALFGDLPVYIGPVASFMVAAMGASMANAGRGSQSWRIFAWASLLFGVSCFLWHISDVLPYIWPLPYFAGCSTLASLALLLEFGRRDCIGEDRPPFFSPSFYVSIGGLSIAGLAIDFPSMLPLLLFAWGAPAFLLAARVFWREGRASSGKGGAWGWHALAASCLLGGILFCAASLDWIFSWSDGLLSTAVSAWALGALWPLLALPPFAFLVYRALREAETSCPIGIRRILAQSAAFIFLAFAASLLVFYASCRLIELESFIFKKDRQSLAKLIDESVNGSLSLAGNISDFLSETPGIAGYLANPAPPGAEPKWLERILDRQASLLPRQSICYVMDRRGLCLASSKAFGKDISGRSFSFRRYFKDAIEKGSGTEVALGSATMEPGLYFAKAIYSDAKAVAGVAAVKIGLRRSVELAGGDVAMLVDPNGRSVISNNPAFEQIDMNSMDGAKLRKLQVPGRHFDGSAGHFNSRLEQPSLMFMDSSALPSWRIAIFCKPDNAIGACRITGMGLAVVVALAFGVGLSMRYADFWNAVAIKRMLSWRNAILDSQAVGVAIFDDAFNFIETNKRFRSMFNLQDAPLENLRLGSFFKSFRAFEGFSAEASAAIDSSGVYSSLLEFQVKDGAVMWCEVFGHRLEGQAHASSSVWTFIDKTDSKSSDDLLRESEERYRAIFDNAPIGIVVYDGRGPCLMVNPTYSLITGGSQAAVLQQDFRCLKSWRNTGLLKLAEATLCDGKPREMLCRSKTSFGKPLVGRCILSSSSYGSGRLLALMLEDHTERDVAERRNMDLMLKYEQLFKLMPAAAFTVDCSGVVTSFNAMAEAITGFTAAEAIGSSCHKFTDEPCTRQCGLFLESVAKPIIGKECGIITKDGRKRRIVKNADLLRDETGRISGGIETFFDVTALKETSSKLEVACAAAEGAAQAKGEFLARMSHEIRSPMNGVLGQAHLLLQGSLMKEQRERVETILKAGERILAVMNDVLDISKIETGTLVLNPLPTDVRTLLADTVRILLPRAVAKELELKFTPSDGVPSSLLVDPFRLRQIAFNLVSNALKFTAAGHVEVRLLKADGPGAPDVFMLRLEVADTGSGIAKDVLPKLFDKFSPAGSVNVAVSGGTGLGLAICKQLVQMMGGSIDVESETGRGSVFRVDLPLKTVLPPEEERVAHERNAASGQGAKFDGHVLIVEDNMVSRMVVSGHLKRLGCRVDEAFSGEMAVEMFGAGSYDLVIVDLQLEGVTGYEVAQRMRQDKTSTPIIAIASGGLGAEVQAELQASGMDGFLRKPIVFDKLVRELSKWLRPAPAAQAPDVPVVDERQILSICDGDPEMLESILGVSPGEFANNLNHLEEALAKGDMHAACVAAHSLKGAASNIGGVRMSAICKEAELAAKEGKLEDPAKTVAAIKAAIPELFEALKAVLSKMRS